MTRLLSITGLFAALATAFIGSTTPVVADQHPRVIFDKHIGGVVWIENHVEKGSYMGSGFLVDSKRKLVVTNYHVAIGEEMMDVFFPVRNSKGVLYGDREYYRKNISALQKTGQYAVGRVVAQAPNKDLVILSIGSLPASAVELSLAETDPSPNEVVHVLGNPSGRDLWRWSAALKPRVGHFKGRYNNYPVEMDYKQITYASSSFSGNSGGPVLNDDGKVVGVHSTGGGEGGISGGAVHYSEVQNLLGTLTQHQVFSIENTTKVTLTYQVRWGEGEWKETKLEPGKVMTHWLKAAGEDDVAKIRFDQSTQEGFQEKVFTLDHNTVALGLNVTPSPKLDATMYYFKYDKTGENLSLFAKKK